MSLLSAFIVPHPPLIVPAVGRGEERRIAATVAAYEEVGRRIRTLAPAAVVLVSPHATTYADYFHVAPAATSEGDFGPFGAKAVRLAVDGDAGLAQAIVDAATAAGLPAGMLGDRRKPLDHGALVPLHFIGTDIPVVRLSFSGLPASAHYRYGMAIAAAAERLGRPIVLVASGDLSHKLTADGPYGFDPAGPVFDRTLTEAIAKSDFGAFLDLDPDLADAAAECGLRGFQMLAGAFDGRSATAELLSYEGPFGVGYAVAAFVPGAPDPTRRFLEQALAAGRERLAAIRAAEDPWVRLARASLESFVKTGRRLKRPEGLAAELTDRKAGVFVSLKAEGRLRGCIGTTGPTAGCVADEIIQNAVSAGTEDPRFAAVTAAELDGLVYSVDVLGESEPCAGPADLDPHRYGVIVRRGGRSGLLLPDLEGVDDVPTQLSIVLRKAGIDAHETYRIERFEVVRHH